MDTKLEFLAAELDRILAKIEKNKNLLIKDLELNATFRLFLQLTGMEERPFTSEEINRLAKQHSYYTAYQKR